MQSSRFSSKARATEASTRPIVEVRGLTIGFGETILLKDASFEVREGDIFVILGRSGSGKTTVLRHLIGLDTPLAGEIVVAGTAPVGQELRPPPYGVAFQSGALFGSMTVAENVALPLEEWTHFPQDVIGAIVWAKLRIVGLKDANQKFPSELSGGMKNRAAIARAMALEPALLFLDEPTAGLDPVSAAALDELLLVLNRVLRLTVIMVSHELPSIFKIATRCIMLDKDSQSIIAAGDPRELRDSSEDPRVHAFFNRLPEPA